MRPSATGAGVPRQAITAVDQFFDGEKQVVSVARGTPAVMADKYGTAGCGLGPWCSATRKGLSSCWP